MSTHIEMASAANTDADALLPGVRVGEDAIADDHYAIGLWSDTAHVIEGTKAELLTLARRILAEVERLDDTPPTQREVRAQDMNGATHYRMWGDATWDLIRSIERTGDTVIIDGDSATATLNIGESVNGLFPAPVVQPKPEAVVLQTTHVELDITWDNQKSDHPANWDWNYLCGEAESVLVQADA